MMQDDGAVDLLERALDEAVDGDCEALKYFFSVLLESSVSVPRRFQHLPLSDSPSYPNDFIDILGVKDKERVLVPVFSRPELIREWSGTEFLSRTLPLTELVALAPEGWWIVLNPGSEVEKELSPWEVEQLKGGTNSIPMLVEEVTAFDAERGMSFLPAPKEFSEMEKSLSEFASTRPLIGALYLVQQEKSDPQALPALVIGVRIAVAPESERDQLRRDLLALAERAVIGSATVQVVMGGPVGGSMLDGVFSVFPAFYERGTKGLLSSVVSSIASKLISKK